MSTNSKEKIILPALQLGKIKFNIGYVTQLIAPSVELDIRSRSKIAITTRTDVDCLELNNGDKILITDHKKPNIPADVSGVLKISKEGAYVWVWHKKIQKVEDEYKKKGLEALKGDNVKNWQGKFRFQQEIVENGIQIQSGLRPPQIGALHAIGSHWSLSKA